MRIRFTSLVIMLSAVFMLTSCLKDDDDTQYNYSHDTGITAFSLGTLNRYLHTTSKSGADSVYKVTYTGSAYKFTIDQTNRRIFNTDSLPYGTDLAHVIASVTAINNGIILLKSATSDSLTYYSNTDSIDFTQPRVLRIAAQDGQRYVDYTVTLNARTVPVGTLSWERKTESQALAELDDVRALSANGRVFVMGQRSGQTVGYTSATSDGTQWTPMSTSFSASASAVTKDSSLYVLDNGTLYSTHDGQSWTTVSTNSNLKKLVAASTAHLYALTTNGNNTTSGIAASADNGLTWSSEALDDDASLLPDEQVGYATYPVRTNDDIDQIIIVGRLSSANDIMARTWTKLDDYSSHPVATSWSYVDNSGITDNTLGSIPSLTVTTFRNRPVAIVNNGGTISALKQSVDGGLTWEDTEDDLPSNLQAEQGKLSITSDAEGSLWIIANGIVWKH